MAVAAANEIDVDVARAFVRERFEELFDQREREVFVDEQHLAVDRRFENEERATGEIDDDARECFVERHVRRAEAADAALVAEGGGEGFAEDEAGVFDGVVVIDEGVAGGDHIEIDLTVARDHFQHVRQKADWRVDGGTASAVEIEDRKSTRLNSSHSQISYAVFCLKKKKKKKKHITQLNT